MSVLTGVFATARPLIGVVHLAPLPGAPRYGGDRASILEAAVRDAEALAAGGADGAVLENFGDAPFHPGANPPQTVAEMTAVAVQLRRRFPQLPLGVNLLRNDAVGALAVASASGASFVRVNVLVGARVTDQGVIEGAAHRLLRARRELDAEGVRILADVDVKHSAPLAPRPIGEEAAECLVRGGADAVIVSGPATGGAADLAELQAVRAAIGERSLLVGSGATHQTAAELARWADGLICGTALKQDGFIERPVDPARVRRLASAWRAAISLH